MSSEKKKKTQNSCGIRHYKGDVTQMTRVEVQWEEGNKGSVPVMCQGREQASSYYLRKGKLFSR